MRILRVISSMNPSHGGPSQGIRNSIPELELLNCPNEVVCLDDPSADFVIQSPFPIHALGLAKGPWAYHQNLYPWLIINLSQYDVVIVHGLWLYPSYAVAKAIRQLKSDSQKTPKIYVMPHGMLDPWFQRDQTRKLKAWRNELYWRLIEKKVVNQADGLLFTCEQELLLARQTFRGYQPRKELNIGYGIQKPPQFINGMIPAIPNEPYFLFLSRIHPKKGVDLLIEAYQLMSDQHENLPHLVIAGPLDTNYAKSMQENAKDYPKIHFTGMLQGEAKWGGLYGCEAFILPSHQENFGIAVVEALACGKPVLISNQINIWREISSENGCLVENDTLDGTRQLMDNWLGMDDRQKSKMSDGANSAYTKYFAVHNVANRLLAILKTKQLDH